MDAPTAPGIEQTPASCLSPCLLSVGQKLCPEGKPPGSYRIVGASGPGQCIQHPLLMDSISSERLNVGSGGDYGAGACPVLCDLCTDLMLGAEATWPQISHSHHDGIMSLHVCEASGWAQAQRCLLLPGGHLGKQGTTNGWMHHLSAEEVLRLASHTGNHVTPWK